MRSDFAIATWTLQKPLSTTRIAVLGDSFVEALQVPDDHTATRLLERDLAARFPGRSFETMNFGVSNYSFGQYLRVYDTYVRQFKPDYVVALTAYLNFNRTSQPGLSSALQPFYALDIRPSFAIDGGGALIEVPPREHDAYARRVHQLIEDGVRRRSRPHRPADAVAVPLHDVASQDRYRRRVSTRSTGVRPGASRSSTIST